VASERSGLIVQPSLERRGVGHQLDLLGEVSCSFLYGSPSREVRRRGARARPVAVGGPHL